VGSIPLTEWLHVDGAWLPIIGGVALLLLLIVYANGIAAAASHDIRKMVARLPRWAKRTRRRSRAADIEIPADTRPREVAPMALDVSGLSVSFGSVKALDDVALRVEPGRIVGLIGPNGAGKTTLIDAVTGFVGSGGGKVELDGRSITRMGASARARQGLRRSFQSLELFEDITVFENLLVASERGTRLSWLTDLVFPRRPHLSPGAVAAIDRFGIRDALDRQPIELPYGLRRLVGLARTMAAEPSVLLLDEPAAGLDSNESQRLGDLIATMAADDGMGILLVEHDVELVMSICDEVVVLDFGRVIATGPPNEVRNDPAVIAAYLGHPLVTT
jgi:sulfate-transporting ATPase